MSTIDTPTALTLAYTIARRSLDPSTQNGAVIFGRGSLIGSGCNEFPRGVQVTDERLQDRDTKIAYTEHAERNAIFDARHNGIRTTGATMYCPFAACVECSRAIIQSGIRKLVTHGLFPTSSLWDDSITIANSMFMEAGVVVEVFGEKLGLEAIRVKGQLFLP